MANLYKTMTGKKFKELYPDKLFYKITNELECHNNFQYKDGLNEDIIKFNPSGKCESGGLYFAELNDIAYWIDYGVNIRRVVILDDSLVYIEEKKFKTNKFYLNKKISLVNFEYLHNYDFCKLAVYKYSYVLQYIINQTDELCKLAIEKNPYVLRHIINQTDELCKLAIEKNPYVLEYVKNQTNELCRMAIEKNPKILKYVKNQTDELCRLVIEINPYLLKYVNNQTDELCKLAIKINPFALLHIKNQTDELCKLAIDINPNILKYIKN
jgi:hypothetical protein